MRWTFLLLAAMSGSVLAEDVRITVRREQGQVDFHIGKDLVTRYHTAETVAKPYFWPMNAPGTITVTRGWPMEKGLPKETTDHVHQKSAWFCHGDVIPEGIELRKRSLDKRVHGVDFWSETPGHGRIVCVKIEEPQGNSLVTHNVWKSPDGVAILDEVRTIRLMTIGEVGRLLTLEIELHAAHCPITFGDTKEGSLGVRVSDEIKVEKGNGLILNAESKKNGKEVWGKRSDWNDYSGKIGDRAAGIAVFDDPRNKPRALWHTRDYGLMAANPFGRKESGFPDQKEQGALVKLAKGEKLKLRYGIYLHQGDAGSGQVAKAFEQFTR